MNENLDLVEILKDCPKGTKFYSTIYGDVYFEGIKIVSNYPIALTRSDGFSSSVTSKGVYMIEFNGECTLFPSREQRDWSKWQRPFVDGDIIFTKEGINRWVSIFKRNINKECETYVDLLIEENQFFNDVRSLCSISVIKEQRFATKEEKQKLFNVIREKGYKWNTKKKELEQLIKPKFKVEDIIQDENGYKVKITEVNIEDECYEYESIIAKGIGGIAFNEQNDWKLVPNKFDSKILKPFDKVLVRTHPNNNWFATFFSHINYPATFYYKFATTSGLSYKYMIPYNEETEYLLGTNNEAPEYYKDLED